MVDTIGKVTDLPLERSFEWKIEGFTTLSMEEDKYYESPLFYFADAFWCLRIYPNGKKSNNSIGFVDLYLVRKCSDPPISLEFSLILKTMDEQTDCKEDHSYVFKKADNGYGNCQLFKRSNFLERRSELGLPDGLTVICTMKKTESSGDDTSKIVAAECPHCKKEFKIETMRFHEGKCLDKPIKCPECCDVTKLRDWFDHECHKFRFEATEKLLDDFNEMMLNGDNKDTIIRVRGEEFQLHRDVLIARNPYFSSMFKNDMKEKKTGVVSIDDCEPDIFRTFVYFIYTGKVDKLTAENVCNLYETADKYQEDQLKKECLHFIIKSLSVDTFCDYIALALKYDEKELFEKAVETFTSKPKEIVSSVKWQVFSKEYSIQANELFLKTLDKHLK